MISIKFKNPFVVIISEIANKNKRLSVVSKIKLLGLADPLANRKSLVQLLSTRQEMMSLAVLEFCSCFSLSGLGNLQIKQIKIGH